MVNQSQTAINTNSNLPKYVQAQSVKAANSITTPGNNSKVVASHNIQASSSQTRKVTK